MNISLSTTNAYSYNANITMKSISKTSELQPSQKVLGYEVDSKGYFKSDFNKAAGIPEDFKIHSDTMKSLVHMNEVALPGNKSFYSIDIAKTAGNAYKILTQLVDKDTLSKDSFTNEDVAKIPQGYTYNPYTLKVTDIHQTATDYMDKEGVVRNGHDNENKKITTTFYNNSTLNYLNAHGGHGKLRSSYAQEIFQNNIGGKEGTTGLFFNSHGEKYTNSDGSVTKGGLLAGIINKNIFTREGETTFSGKLEGYDKHVKSSQAQMTNNLVYSMFGGSALNMPDSFINSMPKDLQEYLRTDKNGQLANLGIYTDDKDEKPIMQKIFEQMMENHKEMLENIKQKAIEAREESFKQTQKENQKRALEQGKMLDDFTNSFFQTQNELNTNTAEKTDITSDDIKNVFSDIFGLNKKELFQKSYLDLMA